MEWIVIVYDKPGADRNTAVLQEHVAGIPATVNAGIVTSAGGIFQDAERTKYAGSAFNLIVDSKEEAIEFLKKDIFYKNGIWDIDSVIAHPIGVGVRKQKDMPGVEFPN